MILPGLAMMILTLYAVVMADLSAEDVRSEAETVPDFMRQKKTFSLRRPLDE